MVNMGLCGMEGGAWVVGLRVIEGVWVAWVKLLCRLRGLRGPSFYMMGHNYFTWGCIGLRDQTFLRVSKNFCVGLFHGSNFSAWVQQFMLGAIFGGESKKNLGWHFHKILIKSTLIADACCIELYNTNVL